ncbi:ABC transporter substrate-binding protein [Achromobacter aloeverae]
MKTLIAALPVVLACAAPSAAPAASSAGLPARIEQAGKLVIATQPNYPPIAYKDLATGKYTGLDIELGTAIAKQLGLAVEWQETSFVQAFSSLATGRVDLAMIGIVDTPERQKTVDFVDYMQSGPQFFTVQANAAKYPDLPSLCGARVGASRSTNWPGLIAEWSTANCVANGKPPIVVRGTEGSVDARTQLKSGRIDAAVQGYETMPYFQELEPRTYAMIGQPIANQPIGIPVSKREPQLRDAVLRALEALQADGTYDRILAKYKLQATAARPGLNQGK